MKVCRSLDLYGSTRVLAKLVEDLRKTRPCGWRFEGPLGEDIAIFQRSEGQAKLLLLLGFAGPERLMVANIHPTPEWPGDFTMDDYNAALVGFAGAIRPVAQRLGVRVELGSDDRDLKEMMCPPTFEALREFVRAVDSSAPASEAHWYRFLNLFHMEYAMVRPPEFAEWLKSQGWQEETAQRWAEDFSRSLTLLDMRAAMQDRVRVVTLADVPPASARLQ